MTEKQAKKHLERMLRDFTTGSILHLLADLFRQEADRARRDDDTVTYERCTNVAVALFVVGLGVDAACPR
jgi:hypothetical protein